MNNFTKFFSAELSKTASSKAFRNAIIITLVVCVFVAILFGAVSDILQQVYPQLVNVHFASNAEAITYFETAIASYEKTGAGVSDNSLYALKAMLAKYKYLEAMSLDDSMVSDFGAPSGFGVNMVTLFMSVAFMIFSIYSIVACASNIRGEERDGTLKQQLISPMDRHSIFTAKWLSVFIMSAVALIGTFILSMIYSAIVYDLNSSPELIVINANYVTLIPAFSSLLIVLLYYLVTIFILGQFTYFITNMTSIKGNIVLLPLILYFFGEVIENILAYIYVGYAGFFQNLYWINGLSLKGLSYSGMSLYTALAFTTVYATGMTVFNYKYFSMRDVN